MKILILNWRDPKHPFAGGAEKSVLEHAKYWMREGADVTWFAASFEGASKEDQVEGVKIIRKGSHYTVHIQFMINSVVGAFKDFDLIIDCFHFSPFFSPIFMKSTKKIAVVQERAGKLWFKNTVFPVALAGYVLEPLFFRFYKNVSIMTGSESAKEEISGMGINKDHIKVIHHGFDEVGILAKKEKNPTVLFLGFLSKDKGFEDACEAVALVKEKLPSLNFWIAGKEQKKGDYNWSAGRVKQFAQYFGFVTEHKKFELLKKSWVLIHPSEKEGWGLTVIEAASQETPAVGYNVAGLKDSIKNNETGFLVEKDPKFIAEKLQLLLTDEKFLAKMAKEAHLWSKNFSWQKSGKESWALINQIYGSK